MIRNHIPERPDMAEAQKIMIRHNRALKAGCDFRARAQMSRRTH
jgi:hypothetical protein